MSRVRPGRLLGDVIVELGFCDRESVEHAVRGARASGRPMGQLLLEHHMLRSHQLGIAIAERFGLQFVDLGVDEPDIAAMSLLPDAAMQRLDAVPIGFRDDGTLVVAMADPRNLLATDDIAMLTNRNVVPVVVTREDLDTLLTRTHRFGEFADEAAAEAEEQAAREAALEQAADDGPTVKLVPPVEYRLPRVKQMQAGGCRDCADSGYRGRAGIYEVMVVTDEIRALIVARATASQITRTAVDQGMRTLKEAGIAKVRAGETSLAEVARVTG